MTKARAVGLEAAACHIKLGEPSMLARFGKASPWHDNALHNHHGLEQIRTFCARTTTESVGSLGCKRERVLL